MSMENVKQFYQLVVTDQELRQQLTVLSEQSEVQAMDQYKVASLIEQQIIPIATQRGLPFTMEDLERFNQELKEASENGELSVEELDSVAGGLGGGAGAGFCVGFGIGGAVGFGFGACFIIGI